jgi:two-component system sensor histidine kinase UhpB
MSLRFRLNVLISILFVSILVLGTALVIYNARRAVFEETQSTARLAAQLLEVAYGGSNASNQDALRSRLRAEMRSVDDARHLQIALIEGDRELPLADAGVVSDVRAPKWFVGLVAPATMELRRPVSNASGAQAEILVRADPADEIAESWEDARTLLGLVVVFSLIANGLLYVTIGRWLRPVERIVAAMDGIEQGDYQARLPAFDLPELGSIAAKFNHMAEVLERSREENRLLTQQSLAIQEGERRSLARELHDELGQSISAIKAVAVSIAEGGSSNVSRVNAAAGTIADISSQMYAVVRGMMRRLRPVLLDEFGLVRALEELVDGWNDRYSDVFCRLRTGDGLDDLGDTVNITVYRIVQESLTNASKHSGATELEVDVERQASERGDTVHIGIRDDGAGFDQSAEHQGLGLRGMRERVEALQGTFKLTTGVGEGVCIAIAIPLLAVPP